jgi:hypothetical protein
MSRWLRLESDRLAQSADDQALYDRLSSDLKRLENDLASSQPPEIGRGGTVPIDPLVSLPGGTAIEWLDRLSSVRDHMRWSGSNQILEDRTVAGQVKAWIARQEARVQAGEVSPGQHENLVHCLRHFRDFVGADLPVDKIDGNSLESYFLHLTGA